MTTKSIECEETSSRIVDAIGPKRTITSTGISWTIVEAATWLRYAFASSRLASMIDSTSTDCTLSAGQHSVAVLTTRSRTTDPCEARAKRAATGSARSARLEPSNGTRIRWNMAVSFLEATLCYSSTLRFYAQLGTKSVKLFFFST